MAEVPEIYGWFDARFNAVADALRQNFRDHDELGAAVTVTIDGRPVVDIWAGWADDARTSAWQRDTLVNVFSAGKAMVTLALLILVERQQVDLEAPVARYWPQFAAAGKGGVTVRMVLGHRAGLPALRAVLPDQIMYDWERMTTVLAAEEPWWEPGRMHGYHVNTFGFLVGEIVRRVSGENVGSFFRRAVAERLDADFHFGLHAEHDWRVADYLYTSEPPQMGADNEERRHLLRHVYLNPPGMSGLGTVNTRPWRAAEMPSTNGHATARAMARIYSALACGGAVDGIRLLRTETIDAAIKEVSAGHDLVTGRPSRFGVGFQLTQPERPLGPSPRSFGHFGAGGAVGFADPDARLAFAYTMNRSGPRWQNPRNRALIDAVYASL